MSRPVLPRKLPTGHAVARRTEPTFGAVAGAEGTTRAPRVLHPGSMPAQMSLWLRPAGAR